MVHKYDFLVIGSGLAGMSFALKVAHKGKVALICKAGLEEANTYYAQGGIASVTDLTVDNFDKHIEDTMIAGDHISDPAAVEKVVKGAPAQIEELIRWGVNFDKKENGDFDLHKEGGHSEFRILHHKDNTGAEIQTSLIEAVKAHPNITVLTNHFAVEIITQHHMGIIVTRHTSGIRCYGAYVLNEDTGVVDTYLSKVTVMATGGCEAVYRQTTNPLVATGDGIAMVYRAKGVVKDMEFIQFHPSGLYIKDSSKAFLISEAVRGEGAHLMGKDGKRFMVPIHELAELAPRDIVARSIYKQMYKDNMPYVILSLKHLNKEEILSRFPSINAKCQEYGYDLTNEIPVAPAAHYTVGGVVSNMNGRTDIKRLYVCGEIAATGIMGANRLASNSLIECLVFANRAVEDSVKNGEPQRVPVFREEYYRDEENAQFYQQLKAKVSEIMNAHAGIVRTEEGLKEGLRKIEELATELMMNRKVIGTVPVKEYYEDASWRLLIVASLIMNPALLRKESRGGHYREDFPCTDESFQVHSVQQMGQEITTAPVNRDYLVF